jgi:hypothetical protein
VRAGLVGAAALILGALWARRYWTMREKIAGDDPSAAERNRWIAYVGTSLIVGFVARVLSEPGSEIHRVTGDTGGWDSWIMLAGGIVAYALLYTPNAPRDERDHAIDAVSMKVGYNTLCVLLIVFLLLLGFAPRPEMKRFTHWLIANTLLALIMVSAVAQYAAALICYARDRAHATTSKGADHVVS